MVITLCSGWPSQITDFSISVAVGQACTQAPQDTHSESMKGSSCPGETCDSKPRPLMVSAKVPCISSQARTQREQTMHFDGSKVKYGFDSSFLLLQVVGAVDSRSARSRRPTTPAMSCSSQLPLAGQVRQSSGWSEM